MSSTTIAGSAQALLTGLIDYAGIFPPAGLTFEDAVARYAERRASPAGWLLGRFVLPAEQLERFEAASADLPPETRDEPWRLDVVGGQDPARDVALIEAFHRRQDVARVDRVEIRTPRAGEVARARALVAAGLDCFCELPLDEELPALVQAVRDVGAAAKVRTGGVVPAAFPSTAALARFVTAAATAGVRMKATAGLHHAVRGLYPLTYDADSATVVMHGFLNLFVAAAYAWDAASRGADPEGIRRVVERVLDLDDPRLLAIDDQRLAWADLVALPVARVHAARERFALSFGSCSFEEPIAELQALGLL